MSLPATRPSNWLAPVQAVKAIKFPNPVQATQATTADLARTMAHLGVGAALMEGATQSSLVKDGDRFMQGVYDLARLTTTNPDAYQQLKAEIAASGVDKLGDGIHHVTITHIDPTLMALGTGTLALGALFGIRGGFRVQALGDKLASVLKK